MKKKNASKRKGGAAVRSTDGLCGVALIQRERDRQMEKEGYTAEHDDQHHRGEIAEAAACYALEATDYRSYMPARKKKAQGPPSQMCNWPWDTKSWKPKSVIEDLVRAGALIAAEIDRRLRAQGKPTDGHIVKVSGIVVVPNNVRELARLWRRSATFINSNTHGGMSDKRYAVVLEAAKTLHRCADELEEACEPHNVALSEAAEK